MSTVKVNTVTTRSGSTLTLGESGKTVALASGANQSGFGRNGSVNWQTSVKTANFTAASGEGYFIDTASVGAFTMTLPASPSVGDIVALKDYASNFAAANLTIDRNGSNLNGDAVNTTRGTNNESLTLVYADATKGWLAVEEGTGFIGESFIEATGGTITTVCTNFKVHTFTAPGTFAVTTAASNPACNQVSYLVVAGGGGGGECRAGGGGAGGFREEKSPVTPYTSSPIEGAGPISVTVNEFPITVGAGGAGGTCQANGARGSNSIFSSITSTGGGGGGGDKTACNEHDGLPGGSGGAAANAGTKGSGNTPPVSPAQGFDGGCSSAGYTGSGGGGATAVGVSAGACNVDGGAGGAGATTSITGSPVTYAGGGGGGGNSASGGNLPRPAGAGGAGGGGAGKVPGPGTATAGTANTGGGGGGNGGPSGSGTGGAGGSGIVVIRYKFQ